MALLELQSVCFQYDKRAILRDLSFSFEAGNIYAIVGKSGAGKTTLLSVLSGLASPSQGAILYDGENIENVNKYDFRRHSVGVIFQSFNLLTNLTALENVVLSMDIAGVKASAKQKTERAAQLLQKVGLEEDEVARRVLKLSGGQQQRVAIARALSYDPAILLADEPTGNLDIDTQNEIMSIFRTLASEGKCVILVTHSPTVAKASDVVYELQKVKG